MVLIISLEVEGVFGECGRWVGFAPSMRTHIIKRGVDERNLFSPSLERVRFHEVPLGMREESAGGSESFTQWDRYP